MNATNDIAQAAAVKGDKIHAVGSNSDIRALIGHNTRVVDLAGKTLLPGFIDAHGHFPESGVNALYRVNAYNLPISTAQSIARPVHFHRSICAIGPPLVRLDYETTSLWSSLER